MAQMPIPISSDAPPRSRHEAGPRLATYSATAETPTAVTHDSTVSPTV